MTYLPHLRHHLSHSPRHRPAGRKAPWFPVLIALTLLASPAFVAAQTESDPMTEEERVTAIDVLLSFERSDAAEWARTRHSPTGLDPSRFTVRAGGEEQSVVSVQTLEDGSAGGWTQLIYVDCRMASRSHLAWALGALADRAEDLVARGSVEVAVADPAPETLLAASQNVDLLRAVLGQLATRDCSDLLSQLRGEALERIEDAAAGARSEAAREALAAERNLVGSSRLALVTRLTDGLRREGGAQKALFLVHGGHAPTVDFYRPHLGDEAGTVAPAALDGDSMSRIVASYGWTVVALESRAEAEESGAYIGDWFFSGAMGSDNPEETELEVHMELPTSGGQTAGDDGDPWQTFIGGIRGKLRENKDVGKAESYLELGNALLGQGKYERAAESFEKALYHFADAPKTRDQQTIAMVQLGNALAAAGEQDRARHAIEAALDKNPELAERSGAGSVALGDRGHGGLVDATDGAAVRTAQGLDQALDRLAGRTRLTFQMAGEPRGEALALAIAFDRRGAIGHPAWTRSSTPQEVATARLLRLVDDELRSDAIDAGELELAAARREDGSIDVGALVAAAGLDSPSLRLSTAAGTAQGGLVPVEHRALDNAETLTIEVPDAAEFVAVLVEDLETGAWGAALWDG